MSKKKREMMLKEKGYWLERAGKKHEIWTNGSHRVMVSRGAKSNRSSRFGFDRTRMT